MKINRNIQSLAEGHSTHLLFSFLSDVIVVNHKRGFLHPTAPLPRGSQI